MEIGRQIVRGTSLVQIGQCANLSRAARKDTQDADTMAEDYHEESNVKRIGVCCGTSPILLVGKRLGKGSVRNMQACAGIQKHMGNVNTGAVEATQSQAQRATVVKYSVLA